MSSEKTTRFGNLADLIKDSYLPDKKESLAYIGLEHIQQQTLQLNGVGSSIDLQSNKFLFKKDDILFGKLRPYFRKVYKARISGVCSTDIWVLRAKEGVSADYLFYLVASPEFVNQTNLSSKGTHMPRADWGSISKTEWSYFPYSEQEKIGKILGDLDRKIELNRRMNETLEQIGQTLFKKHFVDNPEREEWKTGTVSDLVNIYSGYAFKRDSFDSNGNFGLVTIKNVQDGFFVEECTDRIETIPRNVPSYCHLEKGDVLLSLTGNVGRVCFVTKNNLLLNQRVAKVAGIENQSNAFAYFMFRNTDFKEKLISISRGTAQMNLSPVETKNIKAKVPPQNTISDFAELANPIYKQLVHNSVEISALSELRDSILPKLMSGQITA